MGWIHEEKGSERLKRYRHVALSYFYRSWILSLGYIGRSSLGSNITRGCYHTQEIWEHCVVLYSSSWLLSFFVAVFRWLTVTEITVPPRFVGLYQRTQATWNTGCKLFAMRGKQLVIASVSTAESSFRTFVSTKPCTVGVVVTWGERDVNREFQLLGGG